MHTVLTDTDGGEVPGSSLEKHMPLLCKMKVGLLVKSLVCALSP